MRRLKWRFTYKFYRGTFQKFPLQSVIVSNKQNRLDIPQNDCSEVFALTDEDRAFQARADATGKARSPSVERCVDGTISIDVAAGQRRRRTSTSADFWSVSARYCGAVPLRPRYLRAHNRNWILSGTRNQCSWRRSGDVLWPRWEHQPSCGVQDWLQPLHFAAVWLKDQSTLRCSSPPYW